MKKYYRYLLLLLFSLLIALPKVGTAQVGWAKAYDQAVVVSAEERASTVGKQILRQGGNAVDAAVAVQFALAVTLPRAGNIGGGGFMVIQLADGTSRAPVFGEEARQRAGRKCIMGKGNK